MKPTKIADKIVVSMYRDFISSGNTLSNASYFLSQFPDEPESHVYTAIRILGADGLLSVSYADNQPDNIALCVQAIRQCDENTLIKKGYQFLKEIHSWL